MPHPPFLNPDFLAQLERLSLVARRPVRGWTAGQRRSRRAGNSVEFHDYRPYGVGDDLRYVDWNIYQRTDRLVVRQHVDDEELCLHVLVDASASMGTRDDDRPQQPTKLQWATRLAAALGYVGLTGLERVGLAVMRDRMSEGWPPTRGRAKVVPLFEFLAGVGSSGQTRLNESLSDYAARSRVAGVAVVISDLLDPEGCERGLKALLERGFEAHVVQVLSPAELQPGLAGDVRLVDDETGDMQLMRIDEELLRDYQNNLQALLERSETFCKANAIRYLRASTAQTVEQFVLGPLRGGLLA